MLRTILISILTIWSISVEAQKLSETEISQLADSMNKYSPEFSGHKLLSCVSYSRTLVFFFEVDVNWKVPENHKKTIIDNFKVIGISEFYSKHDINTDFYYRNGEKILEYLSIKASEYEIAEEPE